MTIFSETSDLEYMQLINHNVTVRGAQRNQRNGTYVLDASSIYDLAGFTLYTVFLTMAILVLLKLCIAMMTNKYRVLKESISMEWHFRRSEIWLLYIRQKIIFPPPFNVLEVFVRMLLQKAKCSANRCENSASDVEMSEVKGGQEKLMGEKEKVGSKDFKPTYKQLLIVLKVRYYKAYGCNNCKIHDPCVG
ncbi:uncharacterized protein [Ptychodera flava]|uniref:uncharacterized protein n=1 Tax=Ptychodera flava TaxID=63121 RepID=UPI00396A3540